jgi:hypothetical protein
VWTGYPTRAAFTRAGEGDRCKYDGADFPPDIEEVDKLVCRMSWTMRQPLFAYYIWSGPLVIRAVRAGVSRRTLMRRVRTAEDWIDRQLADNLTHAPKYEISAESSRIT